MNRKTRYLTTDLMLRASFDLTPLADAFTHQGLFPLYVGPLSANSWSATFETAQQTGEGFEEPDGNIAAMLMAIESLEEPLRSLWAGCTLREFDMGYDCGFEPREFYQQLSTVTLSRIATAGATLRITLYAVIETEAHKVAVKILKNDKSIQRFIGKYKGYQYHYATLPALAGNLIEVKVTLIGKKGSVYVHCQMESTNQEAWRVKEILTKKEELQSPTC